MSDKIEGQAVAFRNVLTFLQNTVGYCAGM
jgi:hypothetical protein